MDIIDLIGLDRVISGLRASDKPAVLNQLARRAAAALGIDVQAIVSALIAREQLGSTGIGRGIAVPHARVEGLERFYGLFARLERPIDFAAIDEQPVDLVFLLLIPASAGNEHLAALACVSRRLRDREITQRLRVTMDAGELYQLLAGIPPRSS